MSVLVAIAMARTKEFDENEVLDRAICLFRKRGFNATSFGELTSELGVSRQSLYDTFGDKHAFFHAALRRYRQKAIGHFRQVLATPGPVRPVLQELFDSHLSYICSQGSLGCLMINSMIEQAPHDGDTQAEALANAREIEGLLAQRLAQAQREGDLAAEKDPVALARYLFHILLAVGVAARGLGDREGLRDTVRLALRTLD